MKKLLSLGGTLVKGGIFFLLPLVLLVVILEKAIKIIRPLSDFIRKSLGLADSQIFTPFLFSLLIVLLCCLIAGIIAKRGLGKKMMSWIENNVLVLFPGYKLIKTTFEQRVGIQENHDFPVVLVPIDGWMLAYLVDELEKNQVVVFVPSAPDPWSGNLVIFDRDKIKDTKLDKADVTRISRTLGVGSKEILKEKF
ncbi:DUF502 domain-containing protein [Algoriphagus formosus]|uniref:DUF502 domain-containing protein n=1 Tax=Algoriphagus formosus TaxID=2007308 RepID=A0A4R5UUL7_9BACT|nr:MULTISPECIES: DUF502 domain-containing protein [Algoriphagus]TDK42869.1 DUF502 domain-containing protein [Algoriphagus aquimaris]